MNIRTHARVLAALMLGGAILGLSSAPAHAVPKEPADTGVRCAMTQSDGHVEFYLEGELARDKFGHWKVCGSDGKWHSLVRTDTAPQGPNVVVVGGGFYAP
jgi:hypothetical protein